ncbi:hypothetical protein ALI44B_04620 [Leifsonia sp. ALI-44-B]|uniref:hypothetical protein n=1 Tax=Leifsonia sp. ALI-44-B TaxID=1933776 RepID=UPI00097BD87E|nr:hypothetical protein [Leifsonia sp. ALI-44-B]ONI63914.1 hypothetical protein ALI44B_04620 [Leifsonia sp. ALI-44-B]
MSAYFDQAIDQWRAARVEYELFLEAAYERAETATNGVLLNARGKRAGIDAYTLFKGNETRALAYASEELIEHWRIHPRVPFCRFERDRMEAWS